MNKVIVATGLVGMLALAGCCTDNCHTQGNGSGSAGSSETTKADAAKAEAPAATDISTAGVKALLDSKVAVTILDARTGKYDDGKRIPGAGSLNAESTAEEVAKAIKDKDALVVTYCANPHCPASAKLAAHLRELGYKNVLEYRDGIAGWIEAGYKVDEVAKK